MPIVASFDLGIKNLSYCVASVTDMSGSVLQVDVKRWANLNLLADGADSQSQTRCPCGGPASYSNRTTDIQLICKKCAKKSSKPVLELTETSLADWRTFGASVLGLDSKKMSKKELESQTAIHRLMPYKAPKAKGVTLQALLVAMETCLTAELVHLVPATRIRIENQPSEFAPHMKSVQIMLFTLLDHRLRVEHGWTGTMEFVNAGVKTRGLADAGVGKDAKRSRKLAAIKRVNEILTPEWRTWFAAQAKQDDLADALLMCIG
jgi:hypothetical protein